MSQKKERLDLLLAEKGYFSSRSKAKRAIMAGEVLVNQELIDKAGEKVPVDAKIEVESKQRFVSRGGRKLLRALEYFQVDPAGKKALDIGSSTGGFTDCLLQQGARKVCAVDSGTNQLAWKLRDDDRVEVREQTNFRYLSPRDLGARFELVVVDVSFISLTLILPVAVRFMEDGAELISLVKPQFEAGPENVETGGVVRDPKVHREVIERVQSCAAEHNIKVEGLIHSPITGGKSSNIEYLLYGRYRADLAEEKSGQVNKLSGEKIVEAIDSAHRELKGS
ncbi:TlyA family RNA methyltransferase [Halarsenatibacter silvermanii]|uniref:23S rRNA (Cytidine1920-2'-O)/16S rRNA (Cytidine1409-2'-O)-methyltransferase n=1 Tax=Halarsenatibacter silvermanii TaxID=321763 RepID=A0A1G9PKY6_9FIRM|nr:TlyA family RNA methyltransferase [Halarsenatibacter silvermanii]SDL99450.1 23S rRNA (cytidine1920-2'-O)/16S rRNA (cytidine1409-2'-O)-methyltransferase [Halarsenatibacter silvermanii]